MQSISQSPSQVIVRSIVRFILYVGYPVILIAIALSVRLVFLDAIDWRIDADEAIVGLMAKHFSEGYDLVAFYYGQHYMGSLEAILTSGLFRLFGVSSVALKVVPLAFSVLHVLIVYGTARLLVDRHWSFVAGLTIAVAPNALVEWGTKARGGFIELVVLGSCSLWLLFLFLKTQRAADCDPHDSDYAETDSSESDYVNSDYDNSNSADLTTKTNILGRSAQHPLLLLFLLNAVLGVAWWVNNQAIFYIVTVGIALGCYWFLLLTSGRLSPAIGRIGSSLPVRPSDKMLDITVSAVARFPQRVRLVAVQGLVSACAFVLGSLPFWIYNLGQQPYFLTLRTISGRSSREDILAHFAGVFTEAMPIIFGARRFWSDEDLLPGLSLMNFVVWGLVLGYVVWRSVVRLFADLVSVSGVSASGVSASDVTEAAVQEKTRWRNIGDPSRWAGLFIRYCQCLCRLLIRPEVLLIGFMVVTCSVFAISRYGWLSMAPRYLLPLYSALPLCFVIALSALWRTGQSTYMATGRAPLQILSVILMVVTFSTSLLSNYYLEGKLAVAVPGEPFVFRRDRLAKDHTLLYQWLADNGYNHINANYWIGYRVAFETKEAVTFTRFMEPRDLRIPRYEEVSSFDKEIAPYILVPSQYEIFAHWLREQGFDFRTTSLGDYMAVDEIVRSFAGQSTRRSTRRSTGPDAVDVDGVDSIGENLLTGASPQEMLQEMLQEFPVSVADLSATHGAEHLAKLVDGDVKTRWGSAAPQAPGMQISVSFGEVRQLSRIELSFGRWWHDRPQHLRIYGVKATGEKCQLFDGPEHEALSQIADREEWIITFPPMEVTGVELVQEGSHTLFDWSLAEMKFFGVKFRGR